jgi:RNA polymerase sigma factor (TIGR02999 family)
MRAAPKCCGGTIEGLRAERECPGRIHVTKESDSITDLIRRAQAGDAQAFKGVFDATYVELRALARARLRKNPSNGLLDTTSLVHEAYLRFAESGRLQLDDRQHFLRYASHVMRSVIVDFIRERLAQRRGGDALHVTLNSEVDAAAGSGEREILDVHGALEELAQHDPRLVQVVEMRYFAGMTEAEIATALAVTERTVRRDWQKARLLLADALK